MKLVFFKSKEHKDHYFIFRTRDDWSYDDTFQKITHTGEHWNSGYSHAEIETGFELITAFDEKFMDYLIEHVATNHIHNPDYDNVKFRSWYEFKDINTDKWVNDFYDFLKQKQQEFKKTNGISVQTTLF